MNGLPKITINTDVPRSSSFEERPEHWASSPNLDSSLSDPPAKPALQKKPSFFGKLAPSWLLSSPTRSRQGDDTVPLLDNEPEKPNSPASPSRGRDTATLFRFRSPSMAALRRSPISPATAASSSRLPGQNENYPQGSSYTRLFTDVFLRRVNKLAIDYDELAERPNSVMSKLAFARRASDDSATGSDSVNKHAPLDAEASKDLPEELHKGRPASIASTGSSESTTESEQEFRRALNKMSRRPFEATVYRFAYYLVHNKGFSPEFAELTARIAVQARFGLIGLCRRSAAKEDLTVAKLNALLATRMPDNYEDDAREFYNTATKACLVKLEKSHSRGAWFAAKATSIFKIFSQRQIKLKRIVHLQQRHNQIISDILGVTHKVMPNAVANKQDSVGGAMTGLDQRWDAAEQAKEELEELATLCEELYRDRLHQVFGGEEVPDSDQDTESGGGAPGRPSLQEVFSSEHNIEALRKISVAMDGFMEGKVSPEAMEQLVDEQPESLRQSIDLLGEYLENRAGNNGG